MMSQMKIEHVLKTWDVGFEIGNVTVRVIPFQQWYGIETVC